jgi:predicted porin
MNKTLIAMAVAGVMAAPMAAMADATVYGKINVSIDSGDTGGDDVGANKGSGLFFQSNSGRVGVKGSEDLGGGLSAIWQFESNASFGSGSTAFGGRNSWVGLKGGWGQFRAGKHDTPFKDVGRWFDLFGDAVGDSRNIIEYAWGRVGQVVLPAAGASLGLEDVGVTNWDSRPNNVVAYVSPTFGGGFNFAAAYVIDDATDNASAISANLKWKSGDFLVGLGYESQDNAPIVIGGVDQAGTGGSATGMRVGFQWSPGAFKLNAFYQTTSDNGGLDGVDFDAMGFGAAYTMGKNVLKAQYYMTDNSFGIDQTDANTIAVGWDYNFSKRTQGYIAYATTSNDEFAYNCADAGGHGGEVCGQGLSVTSGGAITGTATAGQDPSVISVGMIHKF